MPSVLPHFPPAGESCLSPNRDPCAAVRPRRPAWPVPSVHTHSRHRDVPAAAAQLHLLARHGQVGEPAAGLVGAVGALSGQVLGGDLGAQGLQLDLVVDLEAEADRG